MFTLSAYKDYVGLWFDDEEELAVGMVNYNSGEVKKIMGAKSSEIEPILGFKNDDEVIHRDNLVITKGTEKGEDVCHLRS